MQHVCSALMWIIRAWGYWRTAFSAIWPQDSHCCILLGGWSLWAYPDSAAGQGASSPVAYDLWSHIRVLVTQFTVANPANAFTSMRRSHLMIQGDIYSGSSRLLGLKHKAVMEITLTWLYYTFYIYREILRLKFIGSIKVDIWTWCVPQHQCWV